MIDRVVNFGDSLLSKVRKWLAKPVHTLYIRVPRRGRRTYVRVAIRRANQPTSDDPHLVRPIGGLN